MEPLEHVGGSVHRPDHGMGGQEQTDGGLEDGLGDTHFVHVGTIQAWNAGMNLVLIIVFSLFEVQYWS